jgi:hypothetical protein
MQSNGLFSSAGFAESLPAAGRRLVAGQYFATMEGLFL